MRVEPILSVHSFGPSMGQSTNPPKCGCAQSCSRLGLHREQNLTGKGEWMLNTQYEQEKAGKGQRKAAECRPSGWGRRGEGGSWVGKGAKGGVLGQERGRGQRSTGPRTL